MLSHAFLKQSIGDMQKQIFKIGDKVDDFQKKLAKYFKSLADFDRKQVGPFFLDQPFFIRSNFYSEILIV